MGETKKVGKVAIVILIFLILILSCKKGAGNENSVKQKDYSENTIEYDDIKKNGIFINTDKIILKCNDYDFLFNRSDVEKYNTVEIIKNENGAITKLEVVGKDSDQTFDELELFMYENYLFFKTTGTSITQRQPVDYVFYIDMKNAAVSKVKIDKSDVENTYLIPSDEKIINETVSYTLDNIIGTAILGKKKSESNASTGELTIIYRINQISYDNYQKFVIKPYSFTRPDKDPASFRKR
jgi:hypothetical protein